MTRTTRRRALIAIGAISCGVGGSVPVAASVASSEAVPIECTAPADGEHVIEVGGEERTYLTFAPPGVGAGAGPVPMAILTHGFSSGAVEFAGTSGLQTAAPAAGVLLLVPQGRGDVADWPIAEWSIDGEYLDAVLAEVIAGGCVDTARVWMGGHSAGSAFTAYYGCSRHDVIDGIVLNAAITPALCNEGTPDTYVVFGTADPLVPYEGGTFGTFELEPTTIAAGRWAARAGCTDGPVGRGIGEVVLALEWSGCVSGADIRLYSVVGGGHVWFGAVGATGPGDQSESIDSGCLLITGALADPSAPPDMTACEG